MNIEQARFNMIEQQIRPWNVLDQQILEILSLVKRERFVPPTMQSLAFTDTELPLPNEQHMLAPKVEARVLQALAVRHHESVLEIGAGSGYMCALLAYCAKQVTSVEIFAELAALARQNLQTNGIANAHIVEGNGANGWPGSTYDAICISGSLPFLPPAFLAQLNIGGRLFAFIGEAPLMQAQLITRLSADSYKTVTLFETEITPLTQAPAHSHFSI